MAASDLTPLMQQYRQIKHRYPDAFLFFRVGDFYEMFYEDARAASKILQITLTSRDKNQAEQVPLCGVPYHAASSYIAKLIRSGHKVAICEQVEDPKLAKTLVRREVVRVITPGTLLETDLLDAKESNYLAALYLSSEGAGLAYLDLSTADFRLAEWSGPNAIKSAEHELALLHPSEILIPESAPPLDFSLEALKAATACVNRLPDESFFYSTAYQTLTKQFHVESLNGFGCEGMILAVSAAGALFNYVRNTQLTSPSNILSLKIHRTGDQLMLDAITQRNLELTRRLSDGQREGSLLATLDKTLTSMGARLLKDWLLHPLLDLDKIRKRQDAVEAFSTDLSLRSRLRSLLKSVSDLERLISRIGLNVASGRDLVALKQSLLVLPPLRSELGEIKAGMVHDMVAGWDDLGDIVSRIEQAIRDDSPPTLKDGGFIKDGFDSQLDEIRAISRDGKGWIALLEAKERQRTGIGSLKVRYNQVFGYYIEVTNTNLASIPQDYIRKQTLVNAERFITPELKEMETKILGAEDLILQREALLFEEIRLLIAQESQRVQKIARAIATLDVLCSLAEVAVLHHYVRPVVDDGLVIRITDGRHPVLELLVSGLPAAQAGTGGTRFIPNDTLLDDQGHNLLIITGPNMAGKSTYMRQVALIVLLAQVGSFVPAQEAVIGYVDRIFTRVGALDNLSAGQSTFMVEMTETATILHNATARSLILLDEIGRGTSTFDGLSIAWAVAEHLHNQIRSRTLFATHYHELTDLALVFPGVQNLKAVVREWNDEIVFLRKIVEGGTDRSYGIQVARLAGLPPPVIQRAREVLTQLERWELNQAGRPRLADSQPSGDAPSPAQARLPEIPDDGQAGLFAPPETDEKIIPPANAGTRRPQA
jgi:DNA mismatch repair protein MutS